MDHTHFPPRLVIPLFILLIAIIFFIGTLRAFTPVHALSNATVSPSATPSVVSVLKTPTKTPVEPENEAVGSSPTVTNSGQALADEGFTPTPTLTPTPVPDYLSDTSGIIALSILLVLLILVGLALGMRSSRKN